MNRDRAPPVLVLLTSLAVQLAGCGRAETSGGPPGEVRFAQVKEVLDSLQCTSCHDFFPLTYSALVDAPAQRQPCLGEVRVIPGDVEGSLLWKKLAPDVAVCGGKMPAALPLFGPPPTPAQLELIRAWIEDGARQ